MVVTVYPILARGLDNHRLHPAPKSWRSKRTQRWSLALWSTRGLSTSTTSFMIRYQRIGQRLDGLHVMPSPLFLWRVNSTSEATLRSCCTASPLNRGSVC